MDERRPKMLRADGAFAPGTGTGGPSSQGSGREGSRRATTAVIADGPVVVVAGFWRRLAGAVVDAALLLPVAVVLSFLASRVAGFPLPRARPALDVWLDLALAGDPSILGTTLLVVIIASLYALVFQATLGQTPGMRALRLRVVDIYGEAPSPLRSLVRTFAYLASTAIFFLGFLWIGFDREKRGLHDWLSGTYVIKA